MKSTITTLMALAVLFLTGTAVCAEPESANKRPFMGVLIDPAPLSGLLSKHLGLAEGQGLRIQNVQKDSPADKAGLERDDLIIGFQGEDVRGYERFVDAIREAGSGTEVSLEIVHLGVRKTVKLTLKPYEGEPDWKYPREPEAVQSWRPGRFFRLEPGDEDWKEMFKDALPPDIDVDVKKFFKEIRTYHHSNGEDYTVTIEGDPQDEDSEITVRIGDDEYTSTLKDIEKLPKKYREAAREAIENARKDSTGLKNFSRRFDVDIHAPWPAPPQWRDYFDKVHPRNFGPMPRLDRGEEMLDRIQEQMRDLRQRMQKQEERYRERLEKLEKYYRRSSPRGNERDSTESDESSHTESKGGQKV